MPDESEINHLRGQLRLYGDWLAKRSQVALSKGPTMHPSDPPDLIGDDGPERNDRRRTGLLLAVAGLVVAGIIGLVTVTNGDESNQTAADQDGESDSATTSTTEARSSVLGIEPDEDERSNSGTDDEGDDMTNDPANPPADQTHTDDANGNGSGESNGSSGQAGGSTTTDGSTGAGDGGDGGGSSSSTTSDPDSDPPPGQTGGTVAFLSPVDGDMIDSNTGADVSVADVTGATRYVFSASQNGDELFELTVGSPGFLMPSRLIALGQGWDYEPGLMTITAAALDGSGRQLATGSVDVIVRAGGGPPGFGPSTSLP